MTNVALVWWKADWCARMSRNAGAPMVRAHYAAQERIWRRLAEQMECEAVRPTRHRSDARGVIASIGLLSLTYSRHWLTIRNALDHVRLGIVRIATITARAKIVGEPTRD